MVVRRTVDKLDLSFSFRKKIENSNEDVIVVEDNFSIGCSLSNKYLEIPLVIERQSLIIGRIFGWNGDRHCALGLCTFGRKYIRLVFGLGTMILALE
jgi:hypothetical protein